MDQGVDSEADQGSCLLIPDGLGLIVRPPSTNPFKAHRLLYHSTLGLRVIKKKQKKNRLKWIREQILKRIRARASRSLTAWGLWSASHQPTHSRLIDFCITRL